MRHGARVLRADGIRGARCRCLLPIPDGDRTFGVYVDPDNDIAEGVLSITARWIEAKL